MSALACGFGCLPMYDWPEIKAATDAFWEHLNSALKLHGMAGETSLLRPENAEMAWKDAGLLLGQTCGLPFTRKLQDRVCLLGAPAYGIDCKPGHYCSVIIGGLKTANADVAALAVGGTIARNDAGSQSGWASLAQHLSAQNVKYERIGNIFESGSHRNSIKSVADGAADLAAIDCVSWELAKRFEPAAAGVQIIGKTSETPGLPFITSLTNADHKNQMREVIMHAITELPNEIGMVLMIEGFVNFEAEDYKVIADNWQQVKSWVSP